MLKAQSFKITSFNGDGKVQYKATGSVVSKRSLNIPKTMETWEFQP